MFTLRRWLCMYHEQLGVTSLRHLAVNIITIVSNSKYFLSIIAHVTHRFGQALSTYAIKAVIIHEQSGTMLIFAKLINWCCVHLQAAVAFITYYNSLPTCG